ncbi:hypothetical protein LZ30DRAFT_772306 [Colletotrichum cereale]|nr:hypothetical protein LZ30DRAFT_772306 [Colletotrichum cereale]
MRGVEEHAGGDHADFMCTIEHILDHYRDQKGLETVLQMIKPGFSKSASMRRRLQAVMRSYPRLAVELLEPLMLELDRWESASALIAPGRHVTTDRGASVPSPVVHGRPSGSVQPRVLSIPAVSPQQDGAGKGNKKRAATEASPKRRRELRIHYRRGPDW